MLLSDARWSALALTASLRITRCAASLFFAAFARASSRLRVASSALGVAWIEVKGGEGSSRLVGFLDVVGLLSWFVFSLSIVDDCYLLLEPKLAATTLEMINSAIKNNRRLV